MPARYLRIPNPNPAEITDQLWWLMLAILEKTPQARNGGILAHKPGYHSSVEYNRSLGKKFGPGGNQWNYSIREDVDVRGNLKVARGIDVVFADAQNGDYSTIDIHSNRLRESGRNPDDHRLDNWREFYGQTDTDSEVEGYDFRHDENVTSDPSHLWHVHGSVSTESVDDWETMDSFLSVWTGETLAEWNEAHMAGDYGQYGPPNQKFVNDPMNRSDHPDIFTADVWGQEMYGQSPYNGKPSPRTQLLTSTAADAAAAKALAVLIDQKVSAPVPVTLTPEQYDQLSRDMHAWVVEATTAALGPVSGKLNQLIATLGASGDILGKLND